ncbi:CLUMA_CG014638, isoform A [Clunio marinus]|uniref:CLUMA_CG014638, isoform A n=1 Tax=Clunio marinus TaxID=568069 RepID=A0A1J1IPP4_9DIPT|nr:CLUMA_CG014638, isoform A [Clunio marinus]
MTKIIEFHIRLIQLVFLFRIFTQRCAHSYLTYCIVTLSLEFLLESIKNTRTLGFQQTKFDFEMKI